ncbi:hypothetical protein FGO68_gene4689 [Halteria grandinella]|uniref:Uncharacterized protein n=1 Tax=Halteria grandinella TaxID=5974 RepID=A0A8J8NAS1_HALGN|nr:hypothetical protein FGO68_gene4689 [Halteria grandinella]
MIYCRFSSKNQIYSNIYSQANAIFPNKKDQDIDRIRKEIIKINIKYRFGEESPIQFCSLLGNTLILITLSLLT